MAERRRRHPPPIIEHSRIPPQAVDLEEAVLGTIILKCGLGETTRILNILRPELFYKDSHQTICQALLNLRNKKSGIDMLLVTAELRTMGELENIGGPYNISLITNRVITGENIDFWYRIIFQKWMQREVIRICNTHLLEAFDDSTDAFDLVEKLKDSISSLYQLNEIESKSATVEMAIHTTFNELVMMQDGGKKAYFRTGFENWDNMISFSPGTLLLSGDGGIGKTSFITALMQDLLTINTNDVSIFWNCIDHDTSSSIIRKFISRKLYVSDKELTGKKGKFDETSMHTILAQKDYINSFDIIFQEKTETARNIGKMFYSFCEKRKDRPLNILLIDNVMRLKENQDKTMKNQNIIDDNIAGAIADISKETKKFNSLVIYLHHMTKEQGSEYNLNSGYRPTKDHIKGSGRFTDVPEQVVLLNRPGNYGKLMNEYKDNRDVLEKMFIVDIVKNTDGPTGLIHFLCEMQYSLFEEL